VTLQNPMHDVVVVGGGPAGLHAARGLAARGLDTVVLEEHSAFGEPVHCTGILAREAFSEFGLSTESVLNELTTARFVSPAGHDVTHKTRTVEAVVIDRAAFDARLAQDAAAAGARLVRSARVTSVRRTDVGMAITTAAETFRARACVLACGGRYGLHRPLGLGVPSLLSCRPSGRATSRSTSAATSRHVGSHGPCPSGATAGPTPGSA
jgi:digeranylgeranylglycerophospholipid reductase